MLQQMAMFCSSLWLSNILFACVCVCVCVPHILNQSSVVGHLGCFRVLAIINSAAMKIGVHESFQIILFSTYMPRNGVVGSYSSSVFSFSRSLKYQFPIMVVTICLPTRDIERVPFSPHPHKHLLFSSAQSCPTLCNPMNRSTPGLLVHHQLPGFTQTHVH